jgi:hypothetical protein
MLHLQQHAELLMERLSAQTKFVRAEKTPKP